MTINRRELLTREGTLVASTALAAPALAQTAKISKFMFVSDLTGIDPIWTTSTAGRRESDRLPAGRSRQHGLCEGLQVLPAVRNADVHRRWLRGDDGGTWLQHKRQWQLAAMMAPKP